MDTKDTLMEDFLSFLIRLSKIPPPQLKKLQQNYLGIERDNNIIIIIT